MRHQQGGTFTDLERNAFANGLARFYRGRLIPVMRGGTDDAGDGGAGAGVDNGQGDGSSGTDGGQGGAGSAVAERTFTQRHVDNLLARQKRAFLTGQQDETFSVPRELQELRAKADKFDELQRESQTELERATTRAAEADKRANDAAERAKGALLKAAVIAEAARKNVVDPDAAFALIDRTSLNFDDDGSPTNIAEAMETLLKAKPYLVGGGRAGNADLGARTAATGPSQLTHADLKNMTPEQIVKADEEGRLNDLKQAT